MSSPDLTEARRSDSRFRPAHDAGEALRERGQEVWQAVLGMFNNSIGYARVFKSWNAQTQDVPFRAARDTTAAVLVMQDKVLGAGKVAFSENTRAFADGYESIPYGNNLYSWMAGIDVADHAEKVKLAHRGPGTLCKE